ncbi:hypothetical protein NE865_00510 [Phthorimaea operculella]|nr:hypothetical protein NE865_00510 [Phthorimaea operculella]
MKQLLVVLLSTLAVALGWDAGLRVKWGVGPFGNDHYIKLPMSLSEAKEKSWAKEARPDADVLPSLELYCHSSFLICVLYDDTGYPAGLQVAFPESEMKDTIWDWETQGYLKWTPSNGKSYQTKHQYFANEDYLNTSADQRLANRSKESMLSANGGSVWVRGNKGEPLVEITKNPEGILSQGFTKQGCIPGMGTHYWRMNKETTCDANLFLWFTLNDRSQSLIGTGLAFPGKLDAKDIPMDWFERPPELAVKVIVPTGPQCLYDIGGNPGFTTIHIYYVDAPWMAFC